MSSVLIEYLSARADAATFILPFDYAKLDRWLTDEVAWQVTRSPNAKEKAQISQTAYLTPLMKVAENAMMSNLLNDYHAVFWLAHSFDIARHFSSIPRRVSSIEAQA